MKANAWNKSRIIPPITNFLVLMFSIMAPAMAKGKVGSGGGEENVTPSEEQSGTRRRNVASAAGGKASWTPPSLLCSCLLTSKEEGGSRNHMTGKDSALSPNSRREPGNNPRRVKIEADTGRRPRCARLFKGGFQGGAPHSRGSRTPPPITTSELIYVPETDLLISSFFF